MAEDVRLMTTEELLRRLDEPSLTVLDVRSPKSYEASDATIKRAIRESPGDSDIEAWAGKYSKEETVVLFCA